MTEDELLGLYDIARTCKPEVFLYAARALESRVLADAEKDAARFIYDDVCDERLRQDQKWGGDAHDDTHTNSDWMDYIWHQMYRWREEVKSNDPSASPRQRFVKIAALAVAAMASIDRKDAAILAAKEKKS